MKDQEKTIISDRYRELWLCIQDYARDYHRQDINLNDPEFLQSEAMLEREFLKLMESNK